ncbi:MAG: DoxX family protein [Bdellovibrionota bacterium]
MAIKGSTQNDLGLLFLRICSGGLMLSHGFPKLQNWYSLSGSFPDPLGIGSTLSLAGAVGAEFFCALLLVLGLATRLAAVPLLFTMLVAAFLVHGADPLQKKELALIYSGMYLALIFLGGGKYSLSNYFPKLKKFN